MKLPIFGATGRVDLHGGRVPPLSPEPEKPHLFERLLRCDVWYATDCHGAPVGGSGPLLHAHGQRMLDRTVYGDAPT